MSTENGKEKKPFSVKEFFKSTSFKCIAVLLAIVLVCGILLTICNSLFEVTEQEKLDRVLSQIYGKNVSTEEVDLSELETEFEKGQIETAYKVKDDGNYLISSTGSGGFSGGTATCWVVVEMTDGAISGIGNVVVVGGGDGAVCALFDVGAQHLAVIHLIDMVAREDQHVIRIVHLDEVQVLIDGVRGAFVPCRLRLLLIRRQDVYAAEVPVKIPRLAVAYVLVEHKRLILRQNAYRVDP